MGLTVPPELEAVSAAFDFAGEVVACEPFGGGHINDSFRLTCRAPEGTTGYLLQRINARVFRAPARVMENIQRVTEHVARRLAVTGIADLTRRTLTLTATKAGAAFHRAADGACWRAYRFIERTRVHALVETPAQAEQAGRAFGEFQRLLADLPPPRLHETIADFHNTPARFEAFDRACAADVCQRVRRATAEIEFARQHRPLADVLLDLQRRGAIPERVVHNDAKITNVLLDEDSGEALCIVDLDTVMPGLSLYDFGDMVRSMTCPAPEDETDLARVEVQPSLFAALARGYVSAAGAFLTAAERAHLVTAGELITLEQGVRFLTDYVAGDTYYKTRHPEHNLERCRAQFNLLQSLQRQEHELSRIVADCAKASPS